MSTLGSSRPVTLKQVASAAGVSYSTAGLVLNGRGNQVGVKKETQQAILEAARRLGYNPSSIARGLSGKRTQTIGILWSGGTPGLSTPISRLFAREAIQRGYNAHMVESFSDPQIIKATLRQFQQQRIDGVIIQLHFQSQDTWNELLTDKNLPALIRTFPAAVVAGNKLLHPTIDQVLQPIGEELGQALDHLATLGPIKPAFAGDLGTNPEKLSELIVQLKKRGYPEKSLLKFNCPIPGRQSPDIPWATLIDDLAIKIKAAECNLVICSSDELAAPLMLHLQAMGINIPQQIRIIGYNNLPLCEYLQPSLTSIDRDYPRVVQAACSLLFNRLEKGSDLPPATITVPSCLFLRASTGLPSPAKQDKAGRPSK